MHITKMLKVTNNSLLSLITIPRDRLQLVPCLNYSCSLQPTVCIYGVFSMSCIQKLLFSHSLSFSDELWPPSSDTNISCIPSGAGAQSIVRFYQTKPQIAMVDHVGISVVEADMTI